MPSLTTTNSQLTTAPKRYTCRHIHASGRRCGSPSLTGEHFCYHHHHHRPQPLEAIGPYERFDLPDFAFEDRPAIQNTLTLLATRIAQNRVDPGRARLLLYLAQLASNNLPREPRLASQPSEKEAPAPIEDPTLDPDLGLLAPELEIPTPDPILSDNPEDLRRQLREAKRALEDTPCPHCNLLPPLPHRWDDEDVMKLNPNIPHRPKHPTPCKPIVLPTLQACANSQLMTQDSQPVPNKPSSPGQDRHRTTHPAQSINRLVIPPYASIRRSRRNGQFRRVSSSSFRSISAIRISSLS